MNKLSVTTHFFFVVVCVVFFSTTSYSEPANLGQLLSEVKTYHDSGTYDLEVTAVIEKAQTYINHRAEENKQSDHPQKLAIVLDIDETSLSNYPKMVQRHFSPDYKRIHSEIMDGDAPPIKPMLALYHDALKHDVTVFFVTGRRESERYATSKNLKAAGFYSWAGLYLKPDSYDKPSVISFKSKARQAIEHKGYTIIANLGDQESDLNGGYAETQYKLPNPYYYIP